MVKLAPWCSSFILFYGTIVTIVYYKYKALLSNSLSCSKLEWHLGQRQLKGTKGCIGHGAVWRMMLLGAVRMKTWRTSVNIRTRRPKNDERPGFLIGRWDVTVWLAKLCVHTRVPWKTRRLLACSCARDVAISPWASVDDLRGLSGRWCISYRRRSARTSSHSFPGLLVVIPVTWQHELRPLNRRHLIIST